MQSIIDLTLRGDECILKQYIDKHLNVCFILRFFCRFFVRSFAYDLTSLVSYGSELNQVHLYERLAQITNI